MSEHHEGQRPQSMEAAGAVVPDNSEQAVGTVIYGQLCAGLKMGKLGFRFDPPFRSKLREYEICAALGEHNSRGIRRGAILLREAGVYLGAFLFCQCESCLDAQVRFVATTGTSLKAQAAGSRSVLHRGTDRAKIMPARTQSVHESREASERQQIELRVETVEARPTMPTKPPGWFKNMVAASEHQQRAMAAGEDPFGNGIDLDETDVEER